MKNTIKISVPDVSQNCIVYRYEIRGEWSEAFNDNENFYIEYSCDISNLPESAIVETNAVFERDAIRPVLAGKLPEQVLELILPHVANHERIMKVVQSGNQDIDTLLEAFMSDPLVKDRASRTEILALVKDMMAATL